MPRAEKKVFGRGCAWLSPATAGPPNFFSACSGCQNKAVGGFMCLEIFQKSIWTASGEPLARSFDKKMVLAPKPTIPFLTTKIEGPFWSVFGGGGAVIINKNR